MPDAPSPGNTNPTERRRWNDDRWTTYWLRREPLTDTVIPYLLDAVALAPGQRVLDIGCGGGRTSIAAGRLVGDRGSVTGADISATLCDLARERAMATGAANVRFETVDMQNDSVPGAPFDVAISQFGVMFFDEPVTAFTNIARHLGVGGRLVFACWTAPARNPWHVGATLVPFLPAVPEPAPGKSPTGPFSLADAERTTGILSAAGFTDIDRVEIDVVVELPESAVIDADQIAFMGVTDADMPAALAAVDAQLQPFRLGPGVSRFPLSVQIFSARRP